MSLPLRVTCRHSGNEGPFVSATVEVPSFNVRRPIDFLIDTGSPFTMISERDASLWNVNNPYAQSAFTLDQSSIGGIGGGALETYRVDRMFIIFDLVGQGQITVGGNNILRIMRNTHPNVTIRQQAISITPSIIGRDFLLAGFPLQQHTLRVRLVYSPHEVFLEFYPHY